jgi:outer membrane receptor protein involved in Fe transport
VRDRSEIFVGFTVTHFPRPRMVFRTFSILLASFFFVAPVAAQTIAELQQASIDELTNIQVTSVSKAPQPLSDAPAAVYVITHDQIMRSGATSLVEILRLAPNLQVAQMSADSWAVTARGFNGDAADGTAEARARAAFSWLRRPPSRVADRALREPTWDPERLRRRVKRHAPPLPSVRSSRRSRRAAP